VEQRARQHLERVTITVDCKMICMTMTRHQLIDSEKGHAGVRSISWLTRLALIAMFIAPVHDAILSQSPPGNPVEVKLSATPTVVGPGTVSTPAEEFRATISPDNRTIIYVVTDHLFQHMTLVQAERRGSGWATPSVVPFSGIWRDGDPSFAPDGRKIYFISNRPLPGDPPYVARSDFNIWYAQRNADGNWSEPMPVDRSINTNDSEMSPSVTRSGTLYFSRGDKIMRAEKRGSGYSTAEVVELAAKGAGDPSISADERFLVVDADGPTPGDADLFVSCRSASGWMPLRRLADPVNSKAEEGDPSVSSDGRTLYFFSRRLVSPPQHGPRPPRAQRATYAQIEHEAVSNIYNGSRNLYSVSLVGFSCGS
jgi:Tol biopolymer transport system component